jgi:DNA primase
MKDDWADFRTIKQSVSMDAVLRKYGINWLRKERGELRGRCPLHQGEGRRTFHVNLTKNVFHCFSCQAGGNVLDLAAALEKCTIREAALRLLDWDGAVPVGPPAAPKLRGAAQNPPLGFELTGVDHSHPYVSQRAITDETARIFQIGVYGGSGMMRGRLVIPIHDEHGILVAYAGRTIDGAEPRYVFPPGFHKSLVVFNLHRALRHCSSWVVVVEGFFDCIRVHQAGVPSVVAIMGLSPSARQRDLLIGNFDEVILMLDGDEAGRRASDHVASGLAGSVRLQLATVPEGKQPDQLETNELRHLLGGVGCRLADTVGTSG